MSVTPINSAARAFLEADTVPGEPGDEIVTAAEHPTLARLVNKHLHGERITAAEYAQASQELGCSKRHIQRQLAVLRSGRAVPKRARFELSSFHKQVIISVKGNVSLAYRRLEAAGEEVPDLDTFWRRWHEQPTGVQRYARHGADGLVDFWLYPPWEAPERNTVWQADHFELPVDVIADGHRTTLVKPWLTLFEDDKTRMPMAWSLLAAPGRQPGADEVCATIAEAIRLRLHTVLAAGRQADAGESTVTAATYLGVGAVWAVDGAARRVAAVFRIPDWITRLALLGAAVLLLLGNERRDKVLNFLAPAGRFVLTAMEQANTAAVVLADSAARVRPDERLECLIAEVLSQQPADTALLAGEVQERLSYRIRTGEPPPVAEVRAALHQYPCFVEGTRHRFRLGTGYQLG